MGRGRWKRVTIPVELYEKIRERAEYRGVALWKVLLDAYTFYESITKRAGGLQELPSVDKAVWYMEKVAMSVGALKASPTEENLKKTLKTLTQIRDRLGVNVEVLERAVNDYYSTVVKLPENPVERHEAVDEVTLELNMALKSVLFEILYRLVIREFLPEQQPQST